MMNSQPKECLVEWRTDDAHLRLLRWYFQGLSTLDRQMAFLPDKVGDIFKTDNCDSINADRLTSIEDTKVDEDDLLHKFFDEYPQICEFYNKIQTIEKEHPIVLREFKRVFVLLADGIHQKQNEIAELVKSFDCQKRALMQNITFYEEEVERDIELKVNLARQKERALWEQMLHRVQSQIDEGKSTMDEDPTVDNRGRHVTSSTGMANNKPVENAPMPTNKPICQIDESLDDDVKQMNKLLELKLNELQKQKTIIGDLLNHDKDSLRSQFTALVNQNSTLRDENDELRSAIMNLTCALSKFKNQTFTEQTGQMNKSLPNTILVGETNTVQMDDPNDERNNTNNYVTSGKEKVCHKSDGTFRIIFIGNSGVGKTSLIRVLCGLEFDRNCKTTIGIDFNVKVKYVDGHKCTVQLWDTAGQERFRSIGKQYYRRSDGVIIVYDVTCEDSFKQVRSWLSDVEDHVGSIKQIPIILLGNKCDLRNEGLTCVNYESALQLAQDTGIHFFECSSLNPGRVNALLDTILRYYRVYKIPAG